MLARARRMVASENCIMNMILDGIVEEVTRVVDLK
jgi:hypothetical protein